MKSCRIVSARQNGGKSTYIETLVANANVPRGFISLKDNKGYSLKNIETNEIRRYLSIEPEFNDRFRSWYIDRSVFKWVYASLENIEEGNVFLDEIGRMELERDGFYWTLEHIKEKNIDLTLAVRDIFVCEVIDFFSLTDAKVVSVPFQSSL